ncbi:MAG TPA: GNAT family N-acetyltransferase [Caulobacteraceae bacterium]|nr:GNAT family N-acetyltransferase [Caulobacteraceae bacterium]
MIIPTLRTPRLEVRTLREADLIACNKLYDDIAWSDLTLPDAERLARRQSWIAWSIDSEREFGRLMQPPYGDRAIVWRETGEFIGLVGLVPAMGPFGRLPSFGGRREARATAEVGLFWAVSPARQGSGIAAEAARALIGHAFEALEIERIIATTEHDNLASQGVMRRLGMTLERNPWPDPPWFQTVGRLDVTATP